MTERTLQHMAREMAGEYYEFVRGAEGSAEKVQIQHRGLTLLQTDPKLFIKTYPTAKDYIAGQRHGRIHRNWESGQTVHIDDGKVYQDIPGWMHWYDMARQRAVEMLNNPSVHDNLKTAIAAAILEDREKQLRQEAEGKVPVNIPQRKVRVN